MSVGAACVGATAVVLMSASASAGADMSAARPPVGLTASPSHVVLSGSDSTTVRLTNAGMSTVVVDVTRAGFGLDLRGRPRIVGVSASRSAANWISFRPRAVSLRARAAASIRLTAKLPSKAEPGDHDALVLFTTRRRVRDGLAVRMRLGVVVVVRAPGTVVHRLRLVRLRAVRAGPRRVLELLVANRGNVTEAIGRSSATVSLFSGGRRVARLTAVPRDLRPRTRGVVQFRYRGRAHGRFTARATIAIDSSPPAVSRAFRVTL